MTLKMMLERAGTAVKAAVRGTYLKVWSFQNLGKEAKLVLRKPRIAEGLMRMVPHLTVEGVLPLPDLLKKDGEDKIVDFKSTMVVLEKLEEYLRKRGYYLSFTKPGAVKSFSGNSPNIEVRVVTKEFVERWAPNEAECFRGFAATLNYLNSRGVLPVDASMMPMKKIGGLAKYLNHPIFGKALVYVHNHIVKDEFVSPDDNDGQVYMHESSWEYLLPFWEEGIRKGGWSEEKISKFLQYRKVSGRKDEIYSRITPRVVKPVLYGADAFGKGTVVFVGDESWERLSGGLDPFCEKGYPVLLTDGNFCKMTSGKDEFQAFLGLHDAPEFETYTKTIGGSTTLRLRPTPSQIDKANTINLKKLKEVRQRLLDEGVEFLFDQEIDQNETGQLFAVTEKFDFLYKGITNERDAKRKAEIAKKKVFEKVLSVQVIFGTGYAVCPHTFMADDYLHGKLSASKDILVSRTKFREIVFELLDYYKRNRSAEVYKKIRAKLLGRLKTGTINVNIGRFPAITPHNFVIATLRVDDRAPEGGVVAHPLLWSAMQGDYDGDTVSIYIAPEMGLFGERVTDDYLLSLPEIKEAAKTEFPRNAGKIFAAQQVCQLATGIVDSSAFAELYRMADSVIPVKSTDFNWSPVADLQTLLTGQKYSVDFPIVEVNYAPSWTRNVRGKTTTGDFRPVSQVITEELDVGGEETISIEAYAYGQFSRLWDSLAEAKDIVDSIYVKNPQELPCGATRIPFVSSLYMGAYNEAKVFGSLPDEAHAVFQDKTMEVVAAYTGITDFNESDVAKFQTYWALSGLVPELLVDSAGRANFFGRYLDICQRFKDSLENDPEISKYLYHVSFNEAGFRWDDRSFFKFDPKSKEKFVWRKGSQEFRFEESSFNCYHVFGNGKVKILGKDAARKLAKDLIARGFRRVGVPNTQRVDKKKPITNSSSFKKSAVAPKSVTVERKPKPTVPVKKEPKVKVTGEQQLSLF